jgi:hypothetical protein
MPWMNLPLCKPLNELNRGPERIFYVTDRRLAVLRLGDNARLLPGLHTECLWI